MTSVVGFVTPTIVSFTRMAGWLAAQLAPYSTCWQISSQRYRSPYRRIMAYTDSHSKSTSSPLGSQ